MHWTNINALTITCCTLLCFEIADYLEGEIILKLQQDETFQHFFIFSTMCEMCPLCVWLFIRLCISRVPQLTYIPDYFICALAWCGFKMYIYMRLCVSVCLVYTVCVCVCVVFMRGRWRCPSTAVDEQKHWNRRSKCSWHRVFLLKGMMEIYAPSASSHLSTGIFFSS